MGMLIQTQNAMNFVLEMLKDGVVLEEITITPLGAQKSVGMVG